MTTGIFLLAEFQESYWIFTHPQDQSFPAQETMEKALEEMAGNSEVQQKFRQVLFENNVDVRLVPIDITDGDSILLSELYEDSEGIPAFNIGQIEFLKLKPISGKAWFEAGTRVSS